MHFQVEMAEALIGNDMRQMGKIMQQVVDNRNNSVGAESLLSSGVLRCQTFQCATERISA